MTMGMILKLQRVRAKKTLRQVSKESGVATATVQRIESGQGADWDDVVEEMAKRFGVSAPRMAARLQEILDRRRSRA